MPAGASDRDDELAFALLNVERQHVIDHVRKAGFKALGFLAVHHVVAHGRFKAGMFTPTGGSSEGYWAMGETLTQQRRVRDDGFRIVNLCPL